MKTWTTGELYHKTTVSQRTRKTTALRISKRFLENNRALVLILKVVRCNLMLGQPVFAVDKRA